MIKTFDFCTSFKFFVLLFNLIFCLSCSHRPVVEKEIGLPGLAINSQEGGKWGVLNRVSETQYESQGSGPSKAIIYVDRFSDKAEVVSHFNSRRQMIQKSFQSYVEPYYGTVTKKGCLDFSNLDGTVLHDKNGNDFFTMNFPVDNNRVAFDCGQGQPPLHAHYEFHYCASQNKVYEVRIYVPISASVERDQLVGHQFQCR